jgi:hypothetical protein
MALLCHSILYSDPGPNLQVKNADLSLLSGDLTSTSLLLNPCNSCSVTPSLCVFISAFRSSISQLLAVALESYVTYDKFRRREDDYGSGRLLWFVYMYWKNQADCSQLVEILWPRV